MSKIGDITIKINMEGYDEAKAKLNIMECQWDRILEKQKKACNSISSERNFVVNVGNKLDIEELAKELSSYTRKKAGQHTIEGNGKSITYYDEFHNK